MTTNPHRTALDKRAAEIAAELAQTNEPTGLDGKLWRAEALRYALIADNLLRAWRELAAKRGHTLGHYDPEGD